MAAELVKATVFCEDERNLQASSLAGSPVNIVLDTLFRALDCCKLHGVEVWMQKSYPNPLNEEIQCHCATDSEAIEWLDREIPVLDHDPTAIKWQGMPPSFTFVVVVVVDDDY